MTRKDLLKKYYDIANYNLLCYSRSYLMIEPKRGYEGEWEDAKDEGELLEDMLREEEKKEAAPEEEVPEQPSKVVTELIVSDNSGRCISFMDFSNELALFCQQALQGSQHQKKQPSEQIARFLQEYLQVLDR